MNKCDGLVKIDKAILKELKYFSVSVGKPMSQIVTDVVRIFLKNK